MKGILFKSEVLKAKLKVLEQYGEAQTRRLDNLKEINKEPDNWRFVYQELNEFYFEPLDKHCIACVRKPRYREGEVVYIKEAWALDLRGVEPAGFERLLKYRSDGKQIIIPKAEYAWFDEAEKKEEYPYFWRSPMFLRAIFARYFIQITNVRPERLQEITYEDVIAEGIILDTLTRDANTSEAQAEFRVIWDSINPKYPWASNPWVWDYTFKLVPKPEANR